MKKFVFVSAFINVNNEMNEKNRIDEQLYSRYVDILLMTIPNIVIYLDGEMYENYYKLFGNKIQLYNKEGTFLPLKNNEIEIMKSENYNNIINRDYGRDIHEKTDPLINLLQHNKIIFLKRTKEIFDSDYYVWIDCDYIKNYDIPYSLMVENDYNEEQILIGCVKSFKALENELDTVCKENEICYYLNFFNLILQSEVMIFPKNKVDDYFNEYVNELNIVKNKLITTCSNGIHLLLINKHRNMFKTVLTIVNGQFFKSIQSSLLNKKIELIENIDYTKQTPLCKIMNDEGFYKEKNNTKLYNSLFNEIKDKEVSMFEFGNWNISNDNLNVNLIGWSKYFNHEKSVFYGGNINVGSLNTKRINTYNINQYDKFGLLMITKYDIYNLWDKNSIPNFDVIIDNCMNNFKDNKCLFESSIIKLKRGGVYIIENIIDCKEYQNWSNDIKNKYFGLEICFYNLSSTNHVMIIKKVNDYSYLNNISNQMFLFDKIKRFSIDYDYVRDIYNYSKNKKRVLEIGNNNMTNIIYLLISNPDIVIDYICFNPNGVSDDFYFLNTQFNNRINRIPINLNRLLINDIIDESVINMIVNNHYDLIEIKFDEHINSQNLNNRLFNSLQNIINGDVLFINHTFVDKAIYSFIKKEFTILEKNDKSNVVISHYNQNSKLGRFKNKHKLFIVSSVIFCDSFFTPENRLKQTMETLQSLKNKDPDCLILIVEGSEYNWYSHQFDDDIMIHYTTNVNQYSSRNKSAGEIILLSNCLDSFIFNNIIQNVDIERIFKISGRYVLTDDFEFKNHLVADISGNMSEYVKSIQTSLFSFTPKVLNNIKNMLREYKLDINHNSIEEILYSYIKKNKLTFKHIIILGVKAQMGTDGQLYLR